MNEDARNEKSTVGKAINTAIIGAGAYGLHKGITSDKAYNWAANQRDNAVANGVLKYNQYTEEFKRQYSANRSKVKYGDSTFVDATWSYADTGNVVNKNSTNIIKQKKIGQGSKTLALKEGLSPEALERQQYLDFLKSGKKPRRYGNEIQKLKGTKRRTVKSFKGKKLKSITKAL